MTEMHDVKKMAVRNREYIFRSPFVIKVDERVSEENGESSFRVWNDIIPFEGHAPTRDEAFKVFGDTIDESYRTMIDNPPETIDEYQQKIVDALRATIEGHKPYWRGKGGRREMRNLRRHGWRVKAAASTDAPSRNERRAQISNAGGERNPMQARVPRK